MPKEDGYTQVDAGSFLTQVRSLPRLQAHKQALTIDRKLQPDGDRM